MVCRSWNTKVDYEYTFEEGGKVRLRNPLQDFTVLYEDWCNDYYILDKWKILI